MPEAISRNTSLSFRSKISTYDNVSPLQASKDTLLVNDQSQDRATRKNTVTNAAIAVSMGITGIVGASSD